MGKTVIAGPHSGGGWQAKKAGNERASAVTRTQAEAIKRGRELAKTEKSELIVQGRDGRIRAKDSEGNDPRRTKG